MEQPLQGTFSKRNHSLVSVNWKKMIILQDKPKLAFCQITQMHEQKRRQLEKSINQLKIGENAKR